MSDRLVVQLRQVRTLNQNRGETTVSGKDTLDIQRKTAKNPVILVSKTRKEPTMNLVAEVIGAQREYILLLKPQQSG